MITEFRYVDYLYVNNRLNFSCSKIEEKKNRQPKLTTNEKSIHDFRRTFPVLLYSIRTRNRKIIFSSDKFNGMRFSILIIFDFFYLEICQKNRPMLRLRLSTFKSIAIIYMTKVKSCCFTTAFFIFQLSI